MKLTEEQLDLIKEEMSVYALTTIRAESLRTDLNEEQRLAVILGKVTAEAIKRALSFSEND